MTAAEIHSEIAAGADWRYRLYCCMCERDDVPLRQTNAHAIAEGYEKEPEHVCEEDFVSPVDGYDWDCLGPIVNEVIETVWITPYIAEQGVGVTKAKTVATLRGDHISVSGCSVEGDPGRIWRAADPRSPLPADLTADEAMRAWHTLEAKDVLTPADIDRSRDLGRIAW